MKRRRRAGRQGVHKILLWLGVWIDMRSDLEAQWRLMVGLAQ
jgi:hypothetical protein